MRLIDADELKEQLKQRYEKAVEWGSKDYFYIDKADGAAEAYLVAITTVNIAPTVDAVERKKAYNKSETGFLCSACSFGDFGLFRDYQPRYCPNCGAEITQPKKASAFYPNADEDGMVDVSGSPFTK